MRTKRGRFVSQSTQRIDFCNEDEAGRFVSQSTQRIGFCNEDETGSFRLPAANDCPLMKSLLCRDDIVMR